MPTERFICLAAGVGLMLALLFAGAHRLPPGLDKLAHIACFACITALVWRGTAGRAPLAVPLALIAVGALDELRQAYVPGRAAELNDFLADATAVLVVAGGLFLRGKLLCVESSRPSPAAMSSRS